MIQKYTFGTPIETGAVIKEELKCMDISLLEPRFRIEKKEEQAQAFLCFTHEMQKEDIVYGLGESIRGINKRGWIYESDCNDDPVHCEEKRSLYGAHNFIMVDGENKRFGLFVDHPGKVIFDVGYRNQKELLITTIDADVNLYVIEADTLEGIVRNSDI